jgi:predicted transcriptional regulator
MPRPRGRRPVVRLSVSLPAQHHAVLLRLAEQEDHSLAGMVRKAVAEYVARSEAQSQAELPLSLSGQRRSA